MAKRKILEIGDNALRKKSREVEKFDARLHALLDDMAETMYDAEGAGLAAPQVGILRRAVLVDVGEGMIELINPVIVESSGEQINPEGCLSIPGRRCTVQRPQALTVRAQDRNGESFEISGEGLMARCLCHEIDHLDGMLYVDIMSREVTPEEMAQAEQGEEEAEQ